MSDICGYGSGKSNLAYGDSLSVPSCNEIFLGKQVSDEVAKTILFRTETKHNESTAPPSPSNQRERLGEDEQSVFTVETLRIFRGVKFPLHQSLMK
jgi:hypothetical protein